MRRYAAPALLVLTTAAACSLFVDLDGLEGGGGDGGAVEAALEGRDAPIVPIVPIVEAGSSDRDAPSLGCDGADLVAAWTFNERSGRIAEDCSGHGLNLKLVGDAGWTEGRDGGGALDLPLGAFGEAVDPGAFQFGGPISVVARLKWRTNPLKARVFAISSYPTNPGFEIVLEAPGDYLRTYVFYDLPDGAVGEVASDSRPVPSNVWTHVASVYDGNTISIFRDGLLEARNAVAGTRRITHEPVYVGRRVSATTNAFDGVVDDLRVYRRALSADEVAAFANE